MLALRHYTICRKVLRQIGDGIAGGLDGAGGPGEAGGGGGVDASRVVHEVGVKPGGLDLVLGEVPRQLVDDGADHLQVAQLLGAYRGTKMAPKAQNLCAATDSGNLSSAEYN